ncbi:hypothetical protein BGZ65_006711 [Modicella reniformis]|uniref:Uncharacterized protein n=1 Tax=Modicella reniformis TaxID=1440133 RepID=A0A9P6LRA1_9FUNG|nr:hypothetical protein BGZ65_006711 [Modicella reniformis]
MSYPTYYGKTKFSMTIPGLDPYFTRNSNPDLWHPNDFAQAVSTTALKPFVQGLTMIGSRGKGSIPSYANKCARFLRTGAGKEIMSIATEVIKLRLASQRKTLTEKGFLLKNDSKFYGHLSERHDAKQRNNDDRSRDSEQEEQRDHDEQSDDQEQREDDEQSDDSEQEEQRDGDEQDEDSEQETVSHKPVSDQDHNEEQPEPPRKNPKTVQGTPGSRPFNSDSKALFIKRYLTLGTKWRLNSGTIVEDRLFKIGVNCTSLHSVHSFMIDIDDTWLELMFSKQDWHEICSQWPEVPPLSKSVTRYIQSFDGITSVKGLKKILKERPQGTEEELVYHCLENWCDIYEDDPSAFTIADKLSESWWQNEAWGVLRKLAKGVTDCKMLPGDVAGVESKRRQNEMFRSKESSEPGTREQQRARIGKKGDMFWRSFSEPVRDWAVVEAAKTWNAFGKKYIIESTSKLPRQLYDILLHRTQEVGGAHKMRGCIVPGLVIGGPVLQQVQLCWGLQGANVTRFGRAISTRLESSAELLSESMDAIFTMLLFRTTVVSLMDRYHEVRRRREQQTEVADRRALLAGPTRVRQETKPGQDNVPQNLLHSSP